MISALSDLYTDAIKHRNVLKSRQHLESADLADKLHNKWWRFDDLPAQEAINRLQTDTCCEDVLTSVQTPLAFRCCSLALLANTFPVTPGCCN